MERDCLEFYENLTSKDVLTSNFTFAAFFISTYEAIKTGICDKVKGLYCVETLQIKDGKFWAETTEKYKNEILDFVHTDKRKNTFKSSLLWLKEGGAIDDDEYIFLSDTARKTRDMYAHNLFDQLGEKIVKEDYRLFEKLLAINVKINKWWSVNIDGFPEGTQCCFDITIRTMFDTLFGDTYEV